MTRQEQLRIGLSLLLAFILSACITALAVLFVLQTTILRASYTKRQLQKADYAANLMETVEEAFVSYGSISGFDEAFFGTVLTQARVEQDLVKEVDTLYSLRTQDVDTESYQQYLYEKLQENAAARGLNKQGEANEALQNLAQLCAQTYKDALGLPMIGTASAVLRQIKTPLLLGGVVLLVLTAGIVLFLWRLNRGRRVLRYAAYATGGSALLLGIPCLVILLSGKVERIALTGKALYYLMITMTTNLLTTFLLTAFVLLLVNVAFALLPRWLPTKTAVSKDR